MLSDCLIAANLAAGEAIDELALRNGLSTNRTAQSFWRGLALKMDSGTETTSITNHRGYDSFGNLKSDTIAAVVHPFGGTRLI
jgi:hypothetical protein